MKILIAVGAVAGFGVLFGETDEEAYARLSSFRSLWETNAVSYYKTVGSINDPACAVANGKWYVDFLSYPDLMVTNRLSDVLYAKAEVISRNADSYGILYNTNCWYALADYIAHLKDESDQRWIDESYDVVTGVMDDGVKIMANTNPLLDFASCKLVHFEHYRLQHTNLVSEIDAINAFYREWSLGVREHQIRERALKRAQDNARNVLKNPFWLFGAKDMSDAEKAICRSNIVERAHLTAEEEHEIFDVVPDWYHKVMGIQRK